MDADTPDTPGTAGTAGTSGTSDPPGTRDPIEALLDEQAKELFPDGSISRVELLRYGDDPRIEPGKLLFRAYVKAPAGSGDDAQPAGAQPLDDWEHAHLAATRKLNEELTRIVPEVTQLEFVLETADGGCHTARFAILVGRAVSDLEERARTGGGTLTPVMARLGPADLETLDTLITAGIATTRAEAVRWALARIRERPAYDRLRERARELDQLKSQF